MIEKQRLVEIREVAENPLIIELLNYIDELEKERDYLNDAVNGLESNLGDTISGKFFKGSR